MIILSLMITACHDNDEPGATRKLPGSMKFTGGAEGKNEGLNISCTCDLNLDLPEFEVKSDGVQQFNGSLAGDIIRIVSNDSGEGFTVAPVLNGDITVTVKTNDSVYLSWPGNAGTGSRFYNEITLFKGILNPADTTVTGTWKCAPFDQEASGYFDLLGTVEGPWRLENSE